MEPDGEHRARQVDHGQDNGRPHFAKRTAQRFLTDPLPQPSTGPLDVKPRLPVTEKPWLQLQQARLESTKSRLQPARSRSEKVPGGELGDAIAREHNDPQPGRRAKEEIKDTPPHRPDHATESCIQSGSGPCRRR